MHLRWQSAVLSAVAGLVGLLAFPWAASASIGVGVQADPVSLSQAAHPGATVDLPALYVVNTGNQAETMGVRVQRLSAGPGRTVPASWIHVANPAARLEPGKSARVALQLVLPSDAKAGPYLSDLVVSGAPSGSAPGVNFGAAAATKLEFKVTPGPAGGSWPAWKWWFVGGLLVVGGIFFGMRRSGLRLRVERTAERSDTTPLGGPHGS